MIGTWYDIATGGIVGHADTSDSICYKRQRANGHWPGRGLIDGHYPAETHCVDISGVPTAIPRIDNPALITGNRISGLFNPSEVDCGELGSFYVTDGVFEFTIDEPGTYNITVKSVPYFDKVFTVTV